MQKKDLGKRISVDLPVGSISLKRFIEEAVRDDNFFDFALENPIGAMREKGVNIDAAEFTPEDFASFFDVVNRLKGLVKKKRIKDLTFEGIFGYDPEIPNICAEFKTYRGFYREWDNRHAVLKQSRFMSFNKEFGILRYQEFGRLRDIKFVKSITRLSVYDREILGVEVSSKSKETNQGYDKSWDAADAKYNKESSYHRSKNFAEVSLVTIEDILKGPLINPVELAKLTAKIDAFIGIEEKALR